MSIEEKLGLIRAKCINLLSLSEKRTPGEWQSEVDEDSSYGNQLVTSMCKRGDSSWYQMVWKDIGSSGEVQAVLDADFIAACAGPAEAGWRSTICIIEKIPWLSWEYRQQLENEIISAWEGII